jgi:YgiT-type zinc finger domain-containing protein
MPDADAKTRAKEKECPLCFEFMRLKTRKQTEHIPGTGQTVTLDVKEWECPECSYQEEFDVDD